MAEARLVMRRLDGREADFLARLEEYLEAAQLPPAGVEERVAEILERVRREGDAALLEYVRQLDGRAVEQGQQLQLPVPEPEAALAALEPPLRKSLEIAAARIRAYHERQKTDSWRYRDEYGNELMQRVLPLRRVGVYVPGGRAAYPSTVLMNVLPARVAGVEEVFMATPVAAAPPPLVLAAAALAGVDRIFAMGGAQAVAAFTYGTESVPRVDKIVGPGNAYVVAAKRAVFGKVGLDMLAGPSEVVILCDGETEPLWVALDLCSQAEHDEQARAILLSPKPDFLERVEEEIRRLLPQLERRGVIRQALERQGLLVQVRDLDQALEVAERIAPEHLGLMVANPWRCLERVRNAGAVFLGSYSSEVLGDYCAGPNHVLPTAGSARFASPLGVLDFQKRSSVLHCSPEGAARLGEVAALLAQEERLTAHARAAQCRSTPRREDS